MVLSIISWGNTNLSIKAMLMSWSVYLFIDICFQETQSLRILSFLDDCRKQV
jgi:hypothetical protein